MTTRGALDRTLLLIRDELKPDVPDSLILGALTETRVAVVGDPENLSSHSGQTAFVTAALLMARSAHRVQLLAPDLTMAGPQPPLLPGRLIQQLLECGLDLLPNVSFSAESDGQPVDLAIAVGDTPVRIGARRVVRMNAGDWAGRITDDRVGLPWGAGNWPVGAMSAATLAATEAFKIPMRRLFPQFVNPSRVIGVFGDAADVTFSLAPADTHCVPQLGRIDWISGGAIANAALFALARVPSVDGGGRIVEPECSELTNLNRYMLLRRSMLGGRKARDLADVLNGGLRFSAITERFEPRLVESIGPLAQNVLVGVDHIPTRWAVQRAAPTWLCIGATTHWSAMASFHSRGLACAQCVHPRDDPGDAPIPTVAFVSFWSGLLTATYLLRRAAADAVSPRQQQVYLTPLRPELPTWGPAPIREDCPTCGGRGVS